MTWFQTPGENDLAALRRTAPRASRTLSSHASLCLGALCLSFACSDPDAPFDAGRADSGPVDTFDAGIDPPDSGEDAGQPADAEPDAGPTDGPLEVLVHLDGVPAADVLVLQGGGQRTWRTNAQGRAQVEVDPEIRGDVVFIASHPEARIRGAALEPGTPLFVELTRFETGDNEAYPFGDPGEPTRNNSTAQCAHCHITINAAWFESPHRSSAKNPVVHDLYAGAAAAFDSMLECSAAGGAWRQGIGPGTAAPAFRCYLGEGLLATVNPACTEPPCELTATEHGDCADCHAPTLDGRLGGRDLLEATGLSYDYGVSCDGCHHVDRVVPGAPAGVAGRLKVLRPTEPAPVALGGGGFLPVKFGPSHDSPNPRMGSSQRDHFRDGMLCLGCHQLDQAPQVPGETANLARWPDGRLPIQSTFEEWRAGPMNPAAPCVECHMPPEPLAANGADLQMFESTGIGIAGGWPRAAGSVRRHSWYGPRQPQSQMLELAAALYIDMRVQNGELTASVRVENASAGHAIPTGEPMRTIVLEVNATCGATPLAATGGDSIPDFGGALDTKASGDDWAAWPGAMPGQVVRVVRRTPANHDYVGFGPFGDGTFDAAQKGMPVDRVVGESTITSVNGNSVVFDRPLPAGDFAYRGHAAPSAGTTAAALAGASGFGFGRILVDSVGRRMAPAFRAVDVASDNRILPRSSYTTEHVFATPCPDPVVTARLWYRAYPLGLAAERGWTNPDRLMTEVRR